MLAGDDIDVKHDNEYIAANPDRVSGNPLCADNGG